MFDIGVLELLVIGIIGLIVIGPERLPEVARKFGTWVGRTRHFINNVKHDINREMRQEELRQALERDASLDELKNIINDTKYTIEDEVNTVNESVADSKSSKQKDYDDDDDFDDMYDDLTDHTDHGLEEGDPPVEHENKPKPKPTTVAQDGGQENESKG